VNNLADLFRDALISIPCPSCGHETKRKIVTLKARPDIVCSSCGATTNVNIDAEQFRKALRIAKAKSSVPKERSRRVKSSTVRKHRES
jgi:uncharacterized Zn finger protein